MELIIEEAFEGLGECFPKLQGFRSYGVEPCIPSISSRKVQ
jgi:hypothetical protein